jgi:hypothetical protein
VTSPPRVKPEEKRKEREKHENNPCTLPTREKGKDAGLTSVRVRINESGLIVRSRGRLSISMKCWGHESLRGHVKYVYGITAVPISLSLVTQAGLLENLHRLDTMIVEKVAKKGRHTITRLGALVVERRTTLVRVAPWGPWLRRGVPGRSRLHAAGWRSSGCRHSVQMRHCQMESRICARGDDGRHRGRQSGACDCREHHEQPERHPRGQTCRCGRVQNQEGRRRHHCR